MEDKAFQFASFFKILNINEKNTLQSGKNNNCLKCGKLFGKKDIQHLGNIKTKFTKSFLCLKVKLYV